MQAGFVGSLLRACKKRLINTAIETSGWGAWEDLAEAVSGADIQNQLAHHAIEVTG